MLYIHKKNKEQKQYTCEEYNANGHITARIAEHSVQIRKHRQLLKVLSKKFKKRR
jgi:uncharacterized coiled-coil protein SlyX